ncbi:immediate early response 3 interacting protein 1 [Columba livia]|uniref:Immediate early response 3 interacting protein 1 n=1 Tax=Columba livia TaxID=8932 RepID=A0A2I0M0N1_COLLI|nr:immediate early response 3 interacting protein 1 [Columba livia]
MFTCSFIKQDNGINATTLQIYWTTTSSVAAC